MDIQIPKTYTDVVNTPEGMLWKEVMDYKLTKLEEVNTWTEIEAMDIPSNAQVLLGMSIKILEYGDKKFRSRWVM